MPAKSGRLQSSKKGTPRFHINIGTIAFLLIVIYIMAYVVSYIGKDKMAIYEVSQSDIVDSIEGTGIAVRKEKTIGARKDGDVYFFVKDGARVEKHGLVYAIDTTGKVQAYVSQLIEKEGKVSSEETSRITESLRSFGETYNDDEFANVYDTHRDISHELSAYTDTLLAKNRKEMEKVCGKNSYVEVLSENEGIVAFSSDGLELSTIDDVNMELFQSHPAMEELRTTEKKKKGDPIYRIVINQRWRLMIPVSEAHYEHLKILREEGKETLKITFDKDNFSTRVYYGLKKSEEETYVVLVFDNFVERYVNQRYLRVKMILSETEGLKIPTSSLVEKKVYRIPKNLLSDENTSSEKNHVFVLGKKNKKKALTEREVKIYMSDEDAVYVGADFLKEGLTLSDEERTESFTLEKAEIIQGVYVVNRGFTVFKKINILEKSDDYCIVSAAESQIELYDRIILNGKAVGEGVVIY